MSIKYPVEEFKLTTSSARVSSHNHYIRAPALKQYCFDFCQKKVGSTFEAT